MKLIKAILQNFCTKNFNLKSSLEAKQKLIFHSNDQQCNSNSKRHVQSETNESM